MSDTAPRDLTPPVVILDRSQLADNIGSVARVMANFGLPELRLVNPRDGWPQERAWATASGADWVLEGIKVFDTVADAIHDLNIVFATTARPRETRQPVRTPRESARILYDETSAGLKCGLLFGGERAGLETTDIALCAGITTIPIDPKHHSLNLAQAVAINAYEWRTLILDAPPPRWLFVHIVRRPPFALKNLTDYTQSNRAAWMPRPLSTKAANAGSA